MLNQYLKFLAVGIINTIFGYSVFAALIFIKFHYTIAILMATILGVLFNFKTIGHFVFKNHKNTLLFKFILIYAIQYGLNIGLLKLLLTQNINIYLANLLVILPLSTLIFVLNKYFVFNKKIIVFC